MKPSTPWMLLLVSVALSACGASDADGTATAAESTSLQSLREEEKLARDVYLALDAQAPIFANIATSEQTHTEAVRTLLGRYAIPDPASSRAMGSFSNATFQTLYGQLVARGQTTTVAALQVGVEIEELDLADLAAMRPLASHDDVRNTLDNLARGSRNHLRAFWTQLQTAGGTYSPQHLDEATFRAILAQAPASGRSP